MRYKERSVGFIGFYLGAQEVEASAVSAQVDEGVRRAEETQLVGIAASGGTVHLDNEKQSRGMLIYQMIAWFVSPRACDIKPTISCALEKGCTGGCTSKCL